MAAVGEATFDVLIRGGRVVDPANGICDEVRDVALRGGVIAAVAALGVTVSHGPAAIFFSSTIKKIIFLHQDSCRSTL